MKLQYTYEPAPTRYIFNDENKENFFAAQATPSSVDTLANIQTELDSLNNNEINNCSRKSQLRSINDKFSQHLRSVASDCFTQTKHKNDKLKPNNPWFNWKARAAKRELRKATTATENFSTSDFIRCNYYLVKGSYKRIISQSKHEFLSKMNKDIENGKVLNWQAFKKLKQQKQEKTDFDSHDMESFETFFSKLYSDRHNTIPNELKQEFLNEADIINENSTCPETLNKTITINEVDSAIKSVKTGKASSTDMISNEILKALDLKHRTLLTNIFNACLNNSVYPWNCSIISPLHKKGNKSDPDNYRAVAVSSVIGKLFSTILLERLLEFRSKYCPDPPNQLGFTKKAQTYDHILTMKTISSKYGKLKEPVFAIFVDFKKAFDSVCRQALFLKLAKIGVTGNFYQVLRNMYSNSYAHIKMSNFLSSKFVVAKGTEQGHPLSPDLFKIFIADLSLLLEFPNCPVLSNQKISHLLWADDLILLALDAKTAQSQLDALANFCTRWGIEVNELKTQAVIFGEKFMPINTTPNFILNGSPLQIVNNYCYLGIILDKSGSVSTAQNDLKIKAMRAFFGLKRSVMRSKLSFKALSTLFDSLIKPILLYGAPIWTPNSGVNRAVIKIVKSGSETSGNLLKTISRSVQEKVHLSFLKWSLGVHRKSSNVGVWGETGRYPLIYQSIRLTLNYFKRISTLNPDSLVAAALREQKSMKLPWYKNIKPLLKLDDLYSLDHVSASKITRSNCSSIHTISKCTNGLDDHVSKNLHKLPSDHHSIISHTHLAKPVKSKKFRVAKILEVLQTNFVDNWEQQKSTSTKLSYYHSVKTKFCRENYLDLVKGFSRRYSTTQLRISAHDYEIERGRYKL